MNDFKGFDWTDPGLRAPSSAEPEVDDSGLDAPAVPEPFIPTPPAVRSPFTSATPVPKGPVLNIDDPGILPPHAPENDWQKLVRPSPREVEEPLAAEPPASLAPPPPEPPAPEPPAPEPAPAEPPPTSPESFEPAPEPVVPAQAPLAPEPAPAPVAEAPAAAYVAPPPPPPRPAARTLATSPAPRPQQPSTFQRAVNLFRSTMPLVQRVLPLLDGNVGTAVSNLMAPRPQPAPPPPPPAAPVNLVPLETGLARLQIQQRELRDQLVDQNSSLKKVQDQLEQVREATDRNTLEQQELLQDLKSVGGRVNLYAYIALALLGFSVLINIVLFVELRRFLH